MELGNSFSVNKKTFASVTPTPETIKNRMMNKKKSNV